MLFSTGTAEDVISSTEKKLFRKKRKRMREWREVEEALSFVIVPGGCCLERASPHPVWI
jgi:hypothetical protein